MTIVFFDLKTTGLATRWCHIIQLSAVCRKRKFNKFIFPYLNITPIASEKTGFTKSRGQLYRYGEPLDTTPLIEALTSFVDFLYSFRRPVILAAHNARGFDALVLIRLLKRFFLWHEFDQLVSGFLDTLPLSRNLFPDLPRHTLQYLVLYFLGVAHNGDDALEDAAVLRKLFIKWSPSRRDISDSTFRILPKN